MGEVAVVHLKGLTKHGLKMLTAMVDANDFFEEFFRRSLDSHRGRVGVVGATAQESHFGQRLLPVDLDELVQGIVVGTVTTADP